MATETMWNAIARREKERDLLLEELKRLVNSIAINTAIDLIYQKVVPIEVIATDLESAEKLIQQIEGEEDA